MGNTRSVNSQYLIWTRHLLTPLGLSLHAKEFAEKFRKEGIAGYMKDVAAPAAANMATDKYGKPTSRGGYLADAFFDVVAGNEITSKV